MKSRLGLILALLLGLLAACRPAAATPAPGTTTSAPPAEAGRLVIGVSNTYTASAWRRQMLADLQAAAQAEAVTLLVESADVPPLEQLGQIERLLAGGAQALLVLPGDPSVLAAALQDAASDGVVVISVDIPVAGRGVLHVGIDQRAWGRLSMDWLTQRMGGQGQLTLIEGEVGHPVNEARLDGALGMLAENPAIAVAARDSAAWDAPAAQRLAASFLASLPQIDGMWTQDGMAQAQLLAVLQARPITGETPPAWPLLTGEARAGYLRLWQQVLAERPDFESIAVLHPPGVAADALSIAVRLLDGAELDPARLGGPYGASLFVPLPEPVLNHNLADWLARSAEQGDDYWLDSIQTEAQIDGYFAVPHNSLKP